MFVTFVVKRHFTRMLLKCYKWRQPSLQQCPCAPMISMCSALMPVRCSKIRTFLCKRNERLFLCAAGYNAGCCFLLRRRRGLRGRGRRPTRPPPRPSPPQSQPRIASHDLNCRWVALASPFKTFFWQRTTYSSSASHSRWADSYRRFCKKISHHAHSRSTLLLSSTSQCHHFYYSTYTVGRYTYDIVYSAV